ncbi:MAG TPA: DedA family protein [Pseudonocardia sp.]|uniref:DedA family protein n=1 Tax=Pseudonocardia sp. TaxID=60912 RepID=UPI002BC381B0|nr:DedA family protein [Pseudonocardia sp.]HTF49974.1 DedA family protein [Pseudonocardia sp.]
MSEIFGHLASLLDRYGYLAVIGIVGVESFGIPAPGQTILIAAAVYAGTGHLNVFGVAAAAFLAATVGDNIAYLIGRFGGRRLVRRYGRYVLLTEERVGRVERIFTRYGARLVVVARFVDGLRQFNGLVAGMAGMHWARFLVFNALGAALWVGICVSLGRLAGRHIGEVYEQFRRYQLYLLLALGAVVVGLILRHWFQRRRRAASESKPSAQVRRGEDA